MFEAYKVAVKLSLINDVSKGLALMSSQFASLSKDATRLQDKLKKIKTIGVVGAAVSGAGFLGLGIIAKSIKPAEDYAHQLNILNMAGLKQEEIAKAVGAAWKTAGKAMTTTATDNLKSFLDLRNIFGDTKEALKYLPEMAKIKTVLGASTESGIRTNANELTYSMAKALDIIGAVKSSEEFNKQAEAMLKVIIATQGKVLPQDYQMFFKYARQAKFNLSDEFKYQFLPTLIMENKAKGGSGSSGGVGPQLAALYRFGVQGIMNQRSAQELNSLGLIPRNSILKTTTTGTTLKGGVKGAELLASNPLFWVEQTLLPALEKKYGKMSENQLLIRINQIFKGNQLAASLVGEMAVKIRNFYRDQEIIKKVKSPDEAIKAAMSNDPVTARLALQAQWENFKTSFLMTIVPVLVPALVSLSEWLNKLAGWMQENKTAAKFLAYAFTGLSAAMAFGGMVIALTAAFKGLAFVLGASGATSIAGAAAGIAARLGTGAALGAAGYAGYKFGGVLTDWLKLDGLGGWLYDITHSQPDNFTNVVSPISSAQSQPTQINTTINVDGKAIAKAVTHHQVSAMNKPAAHGSMFDISMNYPQLQFQGNN